MLSRPVETLAQRLKLARQRRALTQGELASAADAKQPDISKIERGEILQPTSIARLAHALRVDARWLELGDGPEPDWTPEQHTIGGAQSGGRPPSLAHQMSQQQESIDPPTITWESVLSSQELRHKRFKLAMPDDALSPDTPAGTMLIFSAEKTPRVGDGVLVSALDGQRYIRMYAEGPGGTWEARARHEGYLSLNSARDGLQLLATVEARVDGRV